MKDVKALYHEGADFQYEHEEILLGAPTSYSLTHDPKHVSFVLARYKFVYKMLQGKKVVMDLGCGDGIGLPIIAKAVDHVICVEWEQRSLDSIQRRLGKFFNNITYVCADPTKDKLDVKVDAVYSVDFIEHIEPTLEKALWDNVVNCLPDDGIMVTGTPNITASPYASPCSEVQHINLKSMDTLKTSMEPYFENTFMFGMNDEVLHTGYAPMCHYIWAVSAGKRNRT